MLRMAKSIDVLLAIRNIIKYIRFLYVILKALFY